MFALVFLSCSEKSAMEANKQKSVIEANKQEKISNVFLKAKQEQKKYKKYIKKFKYLIIIDYDLPYTEDRLWVYDTETNKIIIKSKVSHAHKSGDLTAEKFSNEVGSGMSSLGSFVTLNSYKGKFGISMRLKGLEKNVNDNALKRSIVFHDKKGYTWSLGCFMTEETINKKLISLTKNGTFVYVHKTYSGHLSVGKSS